MSISRKISTVTGAALASLAGAGSLAVLQTPSMSLVAHADETHPQDTNTNPSVGDNQPGTNNVSTIDDAYKDIQGDTARDTNQAQHSSIGWEFQDPNQAADSWKTPDDTKVEPGTDNTQTDWNIATNTNGKSASDTSYDVTGDSSENKFNPGNAVATSLYSVDKTASVRENWPAIERANMAYDDFVAQYGTYWGPVYWGYYNQGYAVPVVAGGGSGALVVSNNNNNNNNNNSSNNNNGLNNMLGASLMSANNGAGGNGGGNGSGVGSSGSNGQMLGGQQQQQSGQGQNSSSSSSSANSQTTVLPNGTVVNGLVGGLGGFGGVGVVSNNNNNNNNNNNSSNNNNMMSGLSNLSNLANNNAGGNGGNGNGNNGNGNNGQANPGNGAKNNAQATTDNSAKNNGQTAPADKADANAKAKDADAKTADTKTPVATTEAKDGQTSTAVAADPGTGSGSASVVGGSGDGGSVVSAGSTALPQTGNLRLEKSSAVGAGLIAATLIGMGATKKKFM